MAANKVASLPIIVISIALNSATNNPPTKLSFGVITVRNNASNKSLYPSLSSCWC